MKYQDLPEWAKIRALKTVKRWIREGEEEAMELGGSFHKYTESELNKVAMEHLEEQDFTVEEYDDSGECIPPSVNW